MFIYVRGICYMIEDYISVGWWSMYKFGKFECMSMVWVSNVGIKW